MLYHLLVSVVVLLPTSSYAQVADATCDDSDRMTHTLENVLGAERKGIGYRDPDTKLEIWVTRNSADWILVQSYSNGTSCIIASGEAWEGAIPAPA